MAEFISPYARTLQQTGIAYPSYQPLAVVPANKPSIWESYRQALAPAAPVATGIESAVAGMRGNLESAAISALLGIVYGKFGTLDVAGKYPVDGILAALLYAMSVKDSGKPDGFSTDLRNLSQACTAVAVFRKTSEWSRPQTVKDDAKNDSNPVMSRHTSSSSCRRRSTTRP